MLSGSNFNTKSSQLIIELPKTHLKTPITTEENENEKDKEIVGEKEKEKEKEKEEEKERLSFKFNSPYMLEACKHLGYNPDDLKKKFFF